MNQSYFDNANNEIDMIIHAGDISSTGTRFEIEMFLNWFSKLNYKHKILIAGNHDFFFEEAPEYAIESLLNEYPEVTYLNDTNVVIDGIKIHGSPITPYFRNWAFNRHAWEIEKHWELIPDDTDVLITHGPVYGYLDTTNRNARVGCHHLLDKITKMKQLKYFICGHIHEAYGTYQIDEGPMLINASILNAFYDVWNEPIIIKI